MNKNTSLNIANKAKYSLGVLTMVLLSACSGSSSDSGLSPEAPDSVPNLNTPTAFNGSLEQKGEAAVATFLKNGIYNNSVGNLPEFAANPSSTNDSNLQIQFSTTNTQEVGIDELDRIEFNGEQFFISDLSWWTQPEGQGTQIRVLALQNDNIPKEVAFLPVAETNRYVHGLFLQADNLSVISSPSPAFSIQSAASTFFAPIPNEEDREITISIFDVSDIDAVETPDEISIQGVFISSRRIDDQIYIISSFVPTVDDLIEGADTDANKLSNYQKIISSPNQSLLPKVSFNGATQSLLSPDDCYIPVQASELDGYAQLVQITKIDLNNPQNMQGICMSAVASHTYMSADALYLLANVENETLAHKFSFDSSVDYQASGSVPGTIGWDDHAVLRISEQNDILRILTTDAVTDVQNPLHRLYTLEQQGQSLNVVGQLPNDTYPQAIGKPGEDVYAVRYSGDKGYVVTFETIDPLYVLDLSDPSLPAMVGELEIPGFSNYLQPIGNDYILGVGQQVLPGDIPDSGDFIAAVVPMQALKISLFDVRDPANPVVVNSIEKEKSFSPVEFDYRALSVLSNDDVTTFAMPFESWGQDQVLETDGFFLPATGLLVFDVDTLQPSLTEQLEIIPEQSLSEYLYVGDDRSVLTSNGIYYLRGNQLYYQSNQNSVALQGPF
ncbi:beta-propeller domain-containing protein [Glaciecola sp. 1036]|uniref:beta-propeller domain-containing protein n=1 Tax=Alteromonadaceae TaxID=72275 RepID=UPI003CFF840C